MNSRFSFEVDPAQDLVTIVMTGLILPENVSDFFEARRKAHEMLRCPPGQHVTLTDLRGTKIMPQETVDAFALLLKHPQSRARRLAFVVAATLVRKQLARILGGRDAGYFAEPEEAKAWLLEGNAAWEDATHRRSERSGAPFLRSAA